MRTAHEIFKTVGVPIPQHIYHVFIGFRAFNEHDIETIQKDAFEVGEIAGRKNERREALLKKLPPMERQG